MQYSTFATVFFPPAGVLSVGALSHDCVFFGGIVQIDYVNSCTCHLGPLMQCPQLFSLDILNHFPFCSHYFLYHISPVPHRYPVPSVFKEPAIPSLHSTLQGILENYSLNCPSSPITRTPSQPINIMTTCETVNKTTMIHYMYFPGAKKPLFQLLANIHLYT